MTKPENLHDRVPHLEKHRHRELGFLQKDLSRPKVVFVGNPNVGKSLIFNTISEYYVDVSNFPGTTIQIQKTRYNGYDVYDTPGIYGVSSFNEEECVARDIILDADIVLNVVDGTHLERDLFLTQQLLDMGKKVTVLLNFMDEVEKHGIKIDTGRLANFIGVEVLPVSAVKGVERATIDVAVRAAREGVQRKELHSLLHSKLSMLGSQGEALLVLEGDEVIAARHGVQADVRREELYVDRRNRVNYVLNHVLEDLHDHPRFSETLGRLLLQPLTGIPALAFVLYAGYVLVGKLVAQDLVGFTEGVVGKGMWEPWIRGIVSSFLDESSWLSILLVGEFGAVTMTTTYLIFLLLPLVVAFYLALSILEDSGYLPRLATMVDHGLGFLGLNGRAVIPLILGFGCVTSATITARVLGSERERTIATVILQFAIPCSAQMAVIAALLAEAGWGPIVIYTAVITIVLIGVGTALNLVMKGEPEPLLLDLPPLRLPTLRNVARKTWLRTVQFMKEASAWFLAGAFVVGIAHLTGMLKVAEGLLQPLTTGWLQLPPEAATAFIMGVVRRDFGAAGLYGMALSPMQILVALVTITLFVPCIASLMVMMKERGLKEGFAIWTGTWVAAFAVGGMVSQIVI